jgi:DNA-binding beta-propeller fold protein YncE
MLRTVRTSALLLAIVIIPIVPTAAALRIEVLRPVASLPPHLVGLFEEPLGFQQPASGGPYYVFDRRGHTVYSVDAAKTTAKKLIEIGQEMGRIIQPRGFDVAPNGAFVIADAPRGQERIQVFNPQGLRQTGFFLPGIPVANVESGTFVLSGVASLQFTGDRLLISHPESGGLFTEYTLGGVATRSIGELRPTGYEADRELHVAMNAGIPLIDPSGGYYYVFLAGRPMFRKYDAKGALVFERHIEGRELDDYVSALPTRWPSRRIGDREVPYVAPTVRTAAVSRQGDLWIGLTLPYTYVYDAHGDKARTVQFNATGVFSPTSMSFTRGGRLLVTPGCYEFDTAPR